MGFFGRYLFFELKLGIKVTLKSMGSLCMVFLLTIAGGIAAGYFMQQSQIFKSVQVGVVIPGEEETSRLIAQFLASMDSVKSVCEFVYLDEKEAEKKLHDGTLQAVVKLPENFYEDMDSGKNTPAVVYFPSQTKWNTYMFRELLMDGISLVQTTEAGVYAALDASKYRDIRMEWDDVGDFVFMEYLEQAFRRGEIFQETVYSPFGEVGLYQYYTASVFVMFLLLCGLNYGFLYQKKESAVEEKLRAYGIGPVRQSVIKIFVMTGMLWMLSSIVYLLLCAGNLLLKHPFLWLDGETFILLFPFCLGISSFFHMIYALAGGGSQGSVCLLAVNAGMALCSGLIVPSVYLSKPLRAIGSIVPLNLWSRYETGMLFHVTESRDLLMILLLSALTGAIGTLWLWKDTGFGMRCS